MVNTNELQKRTEAVIELLFNLLIEDTGHDDLLSKAIIEDAAEIVWARYCDKYYK